MRASTSRRVGLGFYNYRCESHKSYQYLLAAGMVSRISDTLGVSKPIARLKSPLPFGEPFKWKLSYLLLGEEAGSVVPVVRYTGFGNSVLSTRRVRTLLSYPLLDLYRGFLWRRVWSNGSYPMTKNSPGAKAQWVRRCLMRHSLRGWGFGGFESHSTRNKSIWWVCGWSACAFPHP